MSQDPARIEALNEYSKEEWRDVARLLKPEWTDEDFGRAWDDFQAMKAKKALQ